MISTAEDAETACGGRGSRTKGTLREFHEHHGPARRNLSCKCVWTRDGVGSRTLPSCHRFRPRRNLWSGTPLLHLYTSPRLKIARSRACPRTPGQPPVLSGFVRRQFDSVSDARVKSVGSVVETVHDSRLVISLRVDEGRRGIADFTFVPPISSAP